MAAALLSHLYLPGSLQIMRLYPCVPLVTVPFSKVRRQAVTFIDLKLVLEHLRFPMAGTWVETNLG